MVKDISKRVQDQDLIQCKMLNALDIKLVAVAYNIEVEFDKKVPLWLFGFFY